MKHIILRLLISLLTFAIGFSAVWLAELFPFGVSLFEPASSPVSLDNQSARITEVTYKKPRFTGILRGCGFGYVEVYETDDGQQLSEGATGNATPKKARAEFKKRIVKAVRIVEHIPDYKNYRGESGERVVLVNPPDNRNSKETVSILWYGGGQFITFIDAPSLELALEFEQFLEATYYTLQSF